ncbi:uncharacterized protein LOC116207350 [Punica granatum]|uniref:C2 domain-containing protein n=2 Tax=Punica granatum TaxID=22663 RepID=A0A218Y2N6_PUNGR|nr:uncharacterized protein LOC116207350 [Punica granatum]OWM91567.1 hypothetical protein CDL15_Pgr012326 [Punica granatum]PKI50081.1 hypothetical protein CRG98_029519 [Punica granatum]
MSSLILNPFQLLELNIISAQDLAKVTRSMRTYAVAWVHPDRKLSTRVDSHGRNSPTWNDKFVFRVDDEFLTSDTSGVMIEIYAVHWFKDVLVGRVRVLVGNLVPPPSRPFRHQQHHGMRFVALQVRRPSGRPQGILNIGVAVLDSSMRSMPLYRQLSASAVGYLDLMGEQNPYYHSNNHHTQQQQQQQQQTNQQKDQQHEQQKQILPTAIAKPELRRTKSDTSSMHAVKTLKRKVSFREKPNSVINASEAASSVQDKPRRGSSSMPSSLVNASASALAFASPGGKGKKGKAANNAANKGSEVAAVTTSTPATNRSKGGQKADLSIVGPNALSANKKWVKRPEVAALGPSQPTANKSKWVSSAAGSPNNPSGINKAKLGQRPATSINGKPVPKNLALDFEATNKPGKLYITESELGPSPSEVAAAVAAKLKYQRMQLNDGESSAVGGWSLVESEEGLQSKLERWRMELPPVYDYSKSTVPLSSGMDNTDSKLSSGGGRLGKLRHSRRHTDGGATGGGGLFSCVSNICGCECSIVCGKDSPALER